MLSKTWMKVLLIVLIVACLINGTAKLLKVVSFNNTIENIKTKVLILQNEKKS